MGAAPALRPGYAPDVTGARLRGHRRIKSMRGLLERLEHDEPALAIHPRAARQRDRERQIQRRHLPAPLRAARLELDDMRLQQVLPRVVIAVFVLDAPEDREIAARAEMHLE